MYLNLYKLCIIKLIQESERTVYSNEDQLAAVPMLRSSQIDTDFDL